MDTPITRAELEEFKKRMEDEDHRQNKRLDAIEEEVRQIRELTVSVAKMAQSLETMTEEQKKQGERLEKIENRDGEKWRTTVAEILKIALGIVLGFIFSRIGF